jgi:hypothetical protein
MWSAYTSAMIAWLQNVYEPANSRAAPAPAMSEPEISAASSTSTPVATAPATTEARLSACAASPPDHQTNGAANAK